MQGLLDGAMAGQDSLRRLRGVEPGDEEAAPAARGVGRHRQSSLLADVTDGLQDHEGRDALPVVLLVVVEVDPRSADGDGVIGRPLGLPVAPFLAGPGREADEAVPADVAVAGRQGVGAPPLSCQVGLPVFFDVAGPQKETAPATPLGCTMRA